MTKFKLYLNKDEETRWLNEMTEQGWAVKSFFMGFYSFERCQPGEYLYQIDFLDSFGHPSRNYREFMEETGVEIVCQWGFWVFLRRRAEDGPFELYTDVESTIEHYKKIRMMFKVVTLIEVSAFFVQVMAIFGGAVELWWSPLICAVLIVALMGEVTRINNILAELGQRLGQPAAGTGWTRRRPSPLLLVGMLLNAIALLILHTEVPGYEPVHRVLQIAAIVLIIAGIYRTAHGQS